MAQALVNMKWMRSSSMQMNELQYYIHKLPDCELQQQLSDLSDFIDEYRGKRRLILPIVHITCTLVQA